MKVSISLLFTAYLFNDVQAFAFSVNRQTRVERTLSRSTPEANAVDDYDVTCYIVNEEEIIADGEDPRVVCTGEPEEVCRRYWVVLLYCFFTRPFNRSTYRFFNVNSTLGLME